MKYLHILCMALMVLATACKPITTDFAYSPLHPKAGETVTFVNMSTGGEDWAWDFGDNGTSTSKSPSHIYKKAGIYNVTLTASYKSQKKQLSATIEVVDSVPGITVSKDSVLVFEPVTLTAGVWNPFSHSLTYKWILDTTTLLLSGSLEDKQISVLFTRHSVSVPVRMEVTLGGEFFAVDRQIRIYDQPAPAILMLSEGSVYRQRLFAGQYTEAPEAVSYPEANTLLSLEPDTVDRLGRKIYYRSHGLFVANANGTEPVEICPDEVTAFVVDGGDNRLYWATAAGVWRMPLVQTSNNHFAFVPEQINSLGAVTKIAKDNTPR